MTERPGAGPSGPAGNGGPARKFKDLAPRVASGATIAVLALLALWAGEWWTAALVCLAAGVMAWEYRRMTGAPPWDVAGVVFVLGVVAAPLITQVALLRWGALVAALCGAAAAALDRRAGRAPAWTLGGALYLGVACACFVGLRNDFAYGFQAVLWVALVVMASDIGGYFGGRLIGGPKLWPRVSPKKTWAGSLGGMALSGAAGVAFSAFTVGTFAIEVLAVSVATACVAQAGDLAESSFKRHFEVKDSSNLIPGHGGALDRLDGFLLATLVAATISFARGKAVFIW